MGDSSELSRELPAMIGRTVQDLAMPRTKTTFIGMSGVGKSTILATQGTAHLLSPEQYMASQSSVMKPWEELEVYHTWRREFPVPDGPVHRVDPPRLSTYYEEDEEEPELTAEGDRIQIEKYTLEGGPPQLQALKLLVPSIGGSGTVGTCTPTTFSYGSEPQLLFSFINADDVCDQLRKGLELRKAELAGTPMEEKEQATHDALKELWDAVVEPDAEVDTEQKRYQEDPENYRPPLKQLVRDLLGRTFLCRARHLDEHPDLHKELLYINHLQQLLICRSLNLSETQRNRCLEALSAASGVAWNSPTVGSNSISDKLPTLLPCVALMHVFVPNYLLNAFNMELGDAIGADDGSEYRVQRQFKEEERVDNAVVILGKDLKGTQSVKDYLCSSPYVERWVRAQQSDGAEGASMQLSIVFNPERMNNLDISRQKFNPRQQRELGHSVTFKSVCGYGEEMCNAVSKPVNDIKTQLHALLAQRILRDMYHDMSDSDRDNMALELLRRIPVFYSMPLLGTMALTQLCRQDVKGERRQQMERVLDISKLGALLAALVAPAVHKRDTELTDLSQQVNRLIDEGRWEWDLLEALEPLVDKCLYKKKNRRGTLEHNIGRDSVLHQEMMALQTELRGDLGSYAARLQPDSRSILERALARSRGVLQRATQGTSTRRLGQMLHPSHLLNHPDLQLTRRMQQEIRADVEAFLDKVPSQLAALQKDLTDRIIPILTTTIANYYDQPREVVQPLVEEAVRLIIGKHARTALSWSKRSKAKLSTDIMTQVERHAGRGPFRQACRSVYSALQGGIQAWQARQPLGPDFFSQGQLSASLHHAANLLCSASITPLTGSALPLEQALIDKLQTLLDRVYFNAANAPEKRLRPDTFSLFFVHYHKRYQERLEVARRQQNDLAAARQLVRALPNLLNDAQMARMAAANSQMIGILMEPVIRESRQMARRDRDTAVHSLPASHCEQGQAREPEHSRQPSGASSRLVDDLGSVEEDILREVQRATAPGGQDTAPGGNSAEAGRAPANHGRRQQDWSRMYSTTASHQQMVNFYKFLDENDLELDDVPAIDNKCGFWAILLQVPGTGVTSEDLAISQEAVQEYVARLCHMYLDGARRTGNDIPQFIMDIAAEAGVMDFQNFGAVWAAAWQRIRSLEYAPPNFSDIVMLMEVLRQQRRNGEVPAGRPELALVRYDPTFPQIVRHEDRNPGPDCVRIAIVPASWGVGEQERYVLNHFNIVRPRGQAGPSPKKPREL